MISNIGAILARQAMRLARRNGSKMFQIQSAALVHTLKPMAIVQTQRSCLLYDGRRGLADQTDQSGMAAKILNKVKEVITDELKKELNAVFIFQVSGKNYLLDAHSSRPLKVELVNELPEKVDVTLITDEETFVKMAQGKTKPTTAFMAGKLKIKGNVGVAMKAEKIFKAVKVE